MDKFNPFAEQYSKNEANWRKSISEICKFITDHLEKSDFYDFLEGEEVNKGKMDRWQVRLDELLDKITKRMGYKIDRDKLFMEAYHHIVEQKDGGELNPSKNLDYFCDNVDSLIEKRKTFIEN